MRWMSDVPRCRLVWGRRLKVLALVALLAFAAAPDVHAQIRVNVAWDANTDPFTVGYRVYVGYESGQYLANVDSGLRTSLPLVLPLGATYYIAVRGYDTNGTVGAASPELVVDLVAPPNAPEGARAAVLGNEATLLWDSAVGGGAPLRYLVSVGTSPGAADLLNHYAVGNVFSVSGALPPGTYFARVQSQNVMGISPPSREVPIHVGATRRIQGPTALQFQWAQGHGLLSWTAPVGSGADVPTAYVLEAGTAHGRSDVLSLNVGAVTSYHGMVPAGTYFVRVRGVNAVGRSDPSNEVVIRAAAPGAPTNLGASEIGALVSLQWTAPAGPPAAGYILEAGTGPGLSNIGSLNVGSATTFAAPALPGVYYVRVRAVNAQGVGAPSNEIVIQR